MSVSNNLIYVTKCYRYMAFCSDKEDAPVQWNFQKFTIDENGNWVDFVAPKESPFSEKIVTWIEKE